jgi:pectate lyase, PelA/Pel-15E family
VKTKWSSNKADIILSHQYDNGGWPKNQDYDSTGSGGNDKGTFDNGATVAEMVCLAQIYQNTGNTKYRNTVRKAIDFVLDAQYSKGGWPQCYPLRGGYSDHVTFNDNAMASVLTVLHNAHQKKAPFNNDIFSESDRIEMKGAIDKGVDYILKSQWKQNGKLTVWCAQHGKDDYKPKMARAYELESLSGSESVDVIGFLMTQPQSSEIKAAVKAAIAWFRSPNTYLANYTYEKSVEEKIVYKSGSQMWYRFYDLSSNRGFFSDRDSRKVYDIMDISEERRNGYSWGGNYGDKIISYANSVGY